jgi:hypothetical protein
MIVLASIGLSASAFAACPGANHTIKTLSLNSDGVVTRSVLVQKDNKHTIDGNPTKAEFVPTIRDRITLERGDVLNLNASPTMIDSSLVAEITLKDQDRDDQGIFSTTYHVVETATNSFGGKNNKGIRTAYLVTVKSTYLGKGTYSRGCGEIEKTDLDLESSSDVHH